MSISRCRVFAIGELKPAGDRETAKGRNRESDDHAKPPRTRLEPRCVGQRLFLAPLRLGVRSLPRSWREASRKAAQDAGHVYFALSRFRD
jgi:hypothetical protein